MKSVSELFWDASIEELKQGYIFDQNQKQYICLVCGKSFEKGMIYSKEDIFYEAEKFTQLHIQHAHSSMLESLLHMDKKLTGLTDLQKTLIHFFYMGLSDKEIVKEMNGGSTSTIRNHRFTLREKMKQAKIFLAIMELVEEKTENKHKFISIHRSPAMLDQRYAITEQENEQILKAYFKEGLNGPLSEFPKKEKRKIAILKHIMKRFDADKYYSEKEVKTILKTIYHDDVTIRRYLIEYGFMDRLADGSKYWVKLT